MAVLVEQKLEFLDQPVDGAGLPATHDREQIGVGSADAALGDLDKSTAAANPFRDDPHPSVVWSVRRFGLIGLLVSAVVAGCVRWFRRPS